MSLSFAFFQKREAEQFIFFRIPKLLITDSTFHKLSCEAKLLYGLLLDRMSLSIKNEWYDQNDCIFIIYPISEIMEDLNISKPKAVSDLAELESIGLVSKKRRGLGKPSLIYVKNFAYKIGDTESDNDENIEKNSCDQKREAIKENNDENRENMLKNTDISSNFQKLKNFTSGSKKNLLHEVKKFNPNKTYNNNTYRSENVCNYTNICRMDENKKTIENLLNNFKNDPYRKMQFDDDFVSLVSETVREAATARPDLISELTLNDLLSIAYSLKFSKEQVKNPIGFLINSCKYILDSRLRFQEEAEQESRFQF